MDDPTQGWRFVLSLTSHYLLLTQRVISFGWFDFYKIVQNEILMHRFMKASINPLYSKVHIMYLSKYNTGSAKAKRSK